MPQKVITTFIIGGTPRSGKSVLQKLLLNNYKIPGFATDLLRDGMEIGVPEFGINDKQSDLEKSEILWPYFKGMLIIRQHYSDRLLIEGTNFLPKYLKEFKDKSYIRTCFLGYTEIDPEEKFKQIRDRASPDDDWTNDLQDDELKSYVEKFIEISKYFKKECKIHGMKYFDTSKNFQEIIEKAADYLLNA